MTRAGFLHTVPALAERFDTLVGEQAPGVERIHVADAWMLQTAIREGVTVAVRNRVAGHLRHLAETGADAILVTCSSIGEAAEEAAQALRIPVIRVDQAMATDAVARATASGDGGARVPVVAVLATNTATLGPTSRLIERAARQAGRDVVVSAAVVGGAVAARDAGRPDEHDRLIADAVSAAADEASVIVLAQASMAAAAGRAAVRIPVLTSPAGGVQALLAALAAQAARGQNRGS
jgi:hypothetical protein